MKMKVLEYLITLAESNSINEAAQKLYIAQPSLTKALQLFEEELGVQLFYRKKTGIELTEAGKRILPEARQMVAWYNGWLSLSNQLPLQDIDIYIQTSFPNFILPDVILQFKKKHPDVRVNCEVSETPEQYISQDAERPVLVLFVCGKKAPAEQYAKRQGNPPDILFRGEYCCLVSRKSRLAEKKQLTPADLKEHYLVMKSRLERPSTVFVPLLKEIVPVVTAAHVIQAESVEGIVRLVQANPEMYALSYYPALMRYEGVASGALTYVPFADKFTEGDFCLFYSRQACRRHPALQELVRLIQEAAEAFQMEAGDSDERRQ